MSHIIIGTAGHVDHGKTQLIKALTGIDTDTHKQEKERGITIELGFAYLTLPDGERCGIIDVPGHEKFVRNMLAGAGSIDIALFVVACDEGIMPQSREHLEILSLLGIQRGVIALTKTDLADQDWIDLVSLDIWEEVKGTFLENAPILPVSSLTGAGIEKLKNCLAEMVKSTPERKDPAPARLPVDRVFSVSGFGTVVTGTLIEGSLSVGDDLTIYPALISTKVRNLQVHAKNVPTAQRGQRVAVNLAGVKVGDIEKGCVLALPGSMQNTQLLDARLSVVKSTGRKIENNSRLHFHHGTNDVLCRLVLLEKDELAAGESGLAQLHLAAPVAAKPQDHFVVRFYSPTETVGGGVILDPEPQKHKRKDNAALDMLQRKETGTLRERISCFVLDRSRFFPKAADLKYSLFYNSPFFEEELAALAETKEVLFIKDSVIHRDYLEELSKLCRKILEKFHLQNPLVEGMRRDELRARLLPGVPQAFADIVIDMLAEGKSIQINGNFVSNPDFKIAMSEGHKKMHAELLNLFLETGFSPPSFEELSLRYAKDPKAFKQTVDLLVGSGTLVMLTPQILIHCDFYNKALQLFTALALSKEVTLADFRDAIASSRKYAVALLEYFDKKSISKKEGEARRLLRREG